MPTELGTTMTYDPSEKAERARINKLGRMARAMWLPANPPDFALQDGWKDFIRGWCAEDNERRRLRLPSPDKPT